MTQSNKKLAKIHTLLSEAQGMLRSAAGKYDHINFKPPAGVANAAKRGLEYRKKQSDGNKAGLTVSQASKQGIGSGVQRATNLKNRTNLSPATVKRMHAFFSRHRKNKAINPKFKGTPWKDKGWVSWLLWGGDPGAAWAAKVVKQMKAADKKKSKKAGYIGDETYMSRRFLRQMAAQAAKLSVMVKKGMPLEDWQESKLTSAAKDLESVFDSLMYSEDSPLMQRMAKDNEPTNKALWDKVLAITKGDQASFNHNGKEVRGPNDGKGFTKYPSAYANGWAAKKYKDLGGGWKKK
jgi:hypothetical protein